MSARDQDLAAFHPLIRRWFGEAMGVPTEVQRLAWPRIAAGEHVLACAPTGTGKTMAAFLWALNQLLTGTWAGDQVRVLYVSPLKALNNDVQRNLLAPLAQLEAAFAEAGVAAAKVRVLTRSGDTPSEERARMGRHPPEILITTPESLNILLTSARGRAMLSGLTTVILDEVHAVAGSKRGVHLITAVERLVRVAGEVQRVALSATVRPLARVARWVGGTVASGRGDEVSSRDRPVAIVAAAGGKRYELAVEHPAEESHSAGEEFWDRVVLSIKRSLNQNRATLIFANSRRLVEKLTRLINEGEDEDLVYSHHGSLSRELRLLVEERLKAGELRGIVATNSLELGIDIGTLDEVILVQTPPSISSAVQRVGRAGHGVGEVSRARFLSLVGRDLLSSAVIARAVQAGDIEPLEPLTGPLDVLAQVIVSMTASETWGIDDLYLLLRSSDPYRELPQRHFDLVLEMLAGRYASAKVPRLRAVITLDRQAGVVRGRAGAERAVYLSGGTIPDRGTYHLRTTDGATRLGELDEEFVWERSVGDTFTLGVQAWRIDRITHNDVLVSPLRSRRAMAPFWRADARDGSFQLAAMVAELLVEAEARLDDPAWPAELSRSHHLTEEAAAALVSFLQRQRQACTGLLPHRFRLLLERVLPPPGSEERPQLVIHTVWGGRVNRPLALALRAALEPAIGPRLEVVHDEWCVALSAPTLPRAIEVLDAVRPERLASLLRATLEGSGFFGARFRLAAACSLLLPRQGFRRRTPLWLSRLRAKELLAEVRRFDNFPILLEAWRSCLVDDMDIATLQHLLEEVREGRIAVEETVSERPSPFAAGVARRQTESAMYADDTPLDQGPSHLSGSLLAEVARTTHLRPRLAAELVDSFRRKLQRVEEGYSPREPEDLMDWVEERVLLCAEEWHELLAAIRRDRGVGAAELAEVLGRRVVAVRLPCGQGPPPVCAAAVVGRLSRALSLDAAELAVEAAFPGLPAVAAEVSLQPMPDATAGLADDDEDPLAELLASLLRTLPPVQPGVLEGMLAVPRSRLLEALGTLVDAGRVVIDPLLAGSDAVHVCDSENLERLLRLTRAVARPVLAPLPASRLPLFLATWQGLGVGARAGAAADLPAVLDRLLGLGAPVGLWEEAILPARLAGYDPTWLDALLGETGLEWFGCGEKRVAFGFPEEQELALVGNPGTAHQEADSVLPAGAGHVSFEELLASTRLPSHELACLLWRLAWQGLASNDSFAEVRRGAAGRFGPPVSPPPASGRRAQRRGFERWRAGRPFAGRWYRLEAPPPTTDALAAEEANRERARLLLDRYGILFRELVEHELAPLQWPAIWRSLRLMELSGEVVGGQFFAGVGGPQFAAPAAVARLREPLPEELTYWLNACDPASPCGLSIPELAGRLPRRLPTNHIAFCGSQPAVVSERQGRRLTIHLAPDDPRLGDALAFLHVLLERQVRPARVLVVATVNDAAAAASAYREVLTAGFHAIRDGSSLRLSRRY